MERSDRFLHVWWVSLGEQTDVHRCDRTLKGVLPFGKVPFAYLMLVNGKGVTLGTGSTATIYAEVL